MLVLAVSGKIKLERRDEAVEIMVKMREATHKEEGCLAYNFYSPVDDLSTIFVYEEWASEEALQGHFNSEHMAVFREAIPGVLDGEMTVKRYVLP